MGDDQDLLVGVDSIFFESKNPSSDTKRGIFSRLTGLTLVDKVVGLFRLTTLVDKVVGLFRLTRARGLSSRKFFLAIRGKSIVFSICPAV